MSFGCMNSFLLVPVRIIIAPVYIKLFIFNLATLSLHCSIQNLLVAACGIQFPDQGSNLGPQGAQSLSHWTTREILNGHFKMLCEICSLYHLRGSIRKYLRLWTLKPGLSSNPCSTFVSWVTFGMSPTLSSFTF